MPWTGEAKNAGVTAVAEKAKWVGLFKKETSLTTWKSTSTTVLERTAHGLSNGNLVMLDSITGGAGLVAGRPYYVVGATANTLQLAFISGGAATAFVNNVTEASITKLTEATGGSPEYKRVACVLAEGAGGISKDGTLRELNCAAGQQVNYIGVFSAETAGTCYSVAEVGQVTFAAQGVYKVSGNQLDELAAP